MIYSNALLCRHNTQESTNGKIHISLGELKRLMAVVRNGDKQQKLNVDKLTSDFKQLVNVYSKLQNVTHSVNNRVFDELFK